MNLKSDSERLPGWSPLNHLAHITIVSIKCKIPIPRKEVRKTVVQNIMRGFQWSQKQSSLQRKSSTGRTSWEMGQTTQGKTSPQNIPKKAPSLVGRSSPYRRHFQRTRPALFLQRASSQPQESPVGNIGRNSRQVANPWTKPALQRRQSLLVFLNMMASQLPKTFLRS